jgi:hypothetical protein
LIQNNAGVEELHLKIRSSKTDQARNSTTLIVRQQANPSICLLEANNLAS